MEVEIKVIDSCGSNLLTFDTIEFYDLQAVWPRASHSASLKLLPCQ